MKNILYIEHGQFVNSTKVSVKTKDVVTKEEKFFPFEDISCIIFDNPNSYFSTKFVMSCLKKDILVIFCDEKHTPISTLHSEYGYIRKHKRLIQQLRMSQKSKNRVWQKVIKQKITNQNICLSIYNPESLSQADLEGIVSEVNSGDISNRESVAARIYFKYLFGKEFKRFEDDMVNAGLNYTYSIVRSVIRQNLIYLGLEPAFGIHHASSENPFNLSDDVIECFRPIADAFVYDKIVIPEVNKFDLKIKKQLPAILFEQCVIDGKIACLSDAIKTSCESFAKCIETDSSTALKLPKMIEGGR
ncbi:type II CRISPR-associated endonuclease Cas1 [Fundicoccus culcitae]|uniref:CRISPR-associated endonuclease Cas1 n=1 Tax=Fundicoccus culcitae TaxID=2969821 RepID=A0ABY5P5L8_9LACT|nr:type II CRISPR-associated endonuclease Cas1 [Fundicoccus culcitae]UUX33723.1 type II CRISPR-associated endonuclease Cas1 [Fundicoccus culcitae]